MKSRKKEEKRGRDRITSLVDEMQNLPDQESWRDFLERKGDSHKWYYHYTTLSVLRKIIGQDKDPSCWLIPRNTQSNDKTEKCGRSVSFVTSIVSNIGMWSVYCPQPENGVIIEFPHKIWKEIFVTNPELRKKNVFVPHVTDVAYYHIGQKQDGNMFYGQDIPLPENSMRWKFSQNVDTAVPYLKKDIWRFERETRVFYESKEGRSNPKNLKLPIGKEQLKLLRFHLSPMFTFGDGRLFQEKDYAEIVSMILPGQTAVTHNQFVFPRENYGVSLKKQQDENILQAIREYFRMKSADNKNSKRR